MAPVNIFKHGADEERAETARLVGLLSASCSDQSAFPHFMLAFFFPCSRPSWAPSPSATWSRARWGPKGWWVLPVLLVKAEG